MTMDKRAKYRKDGLGDEIWAGDPAASLPQDIPLDFQEFIAHSSSFSHLIFTVRLKIPNPKSLIKYFNSSSEE
ncbi:hypothetical protein EYC84_009144 [Monilinia fructicola]|uniref:Uncharacterized protein n=1 Tax=Monilinia fructicola TaxID=38448 RepID=A0A5M9JAH2_MONFR|nr:hypothetical protein EYC84_009144 [Monilinia fructicola]